jgi:CRISPR-associated protein Cas1
MAACAEAGITLSFCTPHGRFLAAVQGFTPGNVLLRRSQYRLSDNPTASLRIAAVIVAAKLANARTVLLRAMRDHGASAEIDSCAAILARNAQMAMRASDMNALRGLEGDAGAAYFAVFPSLLKGEGFSFPGRVRRPPTDPVNALVSFLYSLLAHDCRSALESVGLDAAVGFLHRDRPGRPSLALDLMEEFRPVLADRCALTLLNRRQISPKDFRVHRTLT